MSKREDIKRAIRQVVDQYVPSTLYVAARTAASKDEDETGAYTDLTWKHTRIWKDALTLTDSILSLHEDITAGRYAMNTSAHGHLLQGKAERFPVTDEHED